MVALLGGILITFWVLWVAAVVVIGGMSYGLPDWQLFALAAGTGLLIGVPAGLWTEGEIRRLRGRSAHPTRHRHISPGV